MGILPSFTNNNDEQEENLDEETETETLQKEFKQQKIQVRYIDGRTETYTCQKAVERDTFTKIKETTNYFLYTERNAIGRDTESTTSINNDRIERITQTGEQKVKITIKHRNGDIIDKTKETINNE